MVGGQSMIIPDLRNMTSGILAGALGKTGSAGTIADTIVRKLGQKRAIAAIAIATAIIYCRQGLHRYRRYLVAPLPCHCEKSKPLVFYFADRWW